MVSNKMVPRSDLAAVLYSSTEMELVLPTDPPALTLLATPPSPPPVNVAGAWVQYQFASPQQLKYYNIFTGIPTYMVQMMVLHRSYCIDIYGINIIIKMNLYFI